MTVNAVSPLGRLLSSRLPARSTIPVSRVVDRDLITASALRIVRQILQRDHSTIGEEDEVIVDAFNQQRAIESHGDGVRPDRSLVDADSLVDDSNLNLIN